MNYVVTLIDAVPSPRFDGHAFTSVQIQEAESTAGPWVTIDTQLLDPVDADPTSPQPRDLTTSIAQLAAGVYRLIFVDDFGAEEITEPVSGVQIVVDLADVRVLIPRVRRKLEGAGAPPILGDNALRDIIADAIGSVILYTGGVFGKDLTVTARDPVYGAPTEYKTTAGGADQPLSLVESAVIACQAALDYFFFEFLHLKTSEVIADEAQRWEYQLSPSLLVAQLKQLQAERDRALDRISEENALDSYVSFVRVRDVYTSQLIEPWAQTTGGLGLDLWSGQEDFRFGVIG